MPPMLENYEYLPLEDPANCIRLLKLLPPTPDGSNDIRGELIPCHFTEAPEYQPVSHTWGQQDASAAILLRDGEDVGSNHENCRIGAQTPQEADTPDVAAECKPTTWRKLSIRPNLEAMLRQFNQLPGSNVFWVDAICINQSDKTEKGHQVRHMNKIYRDKPLLIWLGEPTEDSDRAVDLIEAAQRMLAQPSQRCTRSTVELTLDAADQAEAAQDFAKKCRDSSSWKALKDLIRRPWFSRRWIVQEFVLSRHKHAYIGNRGFCFQYIIYLIELDSQKSLNNLRLDENRRKDTKCRFFNDNGLLCEHSFPAPVPDPVDNIYRLWDGFLAARTGETESLTLERLLDKYASFESSDPRDGIYAFLSMASDIDISEWVPDYSENNTVTDLYSQAVLHIMRTGHSLDIICRSIHSFPYAVSESHVSTWVPWFGLKEYEWCPGHSHSVHGYNTKSLSTFGQPLSTLRDGQAGYLSLNATENRRICKGCKEVITGTGYSCLDCPDFNYCHRCIGENASRHDAAHSVEIFNKAVYFASGHLRCSVDPSLRKFPLAFHPRGETPFLQVAGFLVDCIQGIEEPGDSEIRQYATGSTFLLPVKKWVKVAGKKRMVSDSDGLFGYNFLRALTGNRRVIDGRVCHMTDEGLRLLRQSFKSSTTPMIEDQHGISHSITFMLSNGRRFAATESSLGFVPAETEVGDRIAILIGCSVPVVIRELGTKGDEMVAVLIGECYIEGLMEGEFVAAREDCSLSMQAITLV